MNAPIRRQARPATKAKAEVIRNSISRKEANEIAERLFDGDSPNLSMEEVFAMAAKNDKQPAK